MAKVDRRYSCFEDFLSAQPPLEGLADFISRIPILIFNKLTDMNPERYREAHLHIFPADGTSFSRIIRGRVLNSPHSGYNAGVVFFRHSISSGTGESVNSVGTAVESLAGAPISFPSKDKLMRIIEEGKTENVIFRNPVILQPSNLNEKYPAEQLRRLAYLSVSPIREEDPFRGKLGPYWTEYHQKVVVPIVKRIRNL